MIGLKTVSAEAVEELTQYAIDKPGKIHILELDVTSDESVETAVSQAVELEGQIDVVVNNAGIGGNGWSEAFTMAQVQKIFEVNVFGVQRMMRAVLPAMRARRDGLIVNISSIQGRIVMPYAGSCTASKFAMEGLAESYHYELEPYGIETIIVEPGGFNTKFDASRAGARDEDRTNSYGDDKLAWHKIYGDPAVPKDFFSDPQVLADTVVELVGMPKGERPLRTVVDPVMGGKEPIMINKACMEAQKSLREMMKF